MKKILILVFAIIVSISFAKAQKIELTAFTGYSFNSQLNTYYGKFQVDDSPVYGGILGYGISPDVFVELMYYRTDTRVDYYYQTSFEPFNMSTEYYQIGGQQQFGEGVLKPFAAVSLGMIRFNVKESGGDISKGDAFRFAPTIGGGVKIMPGERIGIRLQARLGMPMEANGLFVGVGTGGASTGVSFRIPIVQFDLSAGLILRLGS
jgi:hypothetical protein